MYKSEKEKKQLSEKLAPIDGRKQQMKKLQGKSREHEVYQMIENEKIKKGKNSLPKIQMSQKWHKKQQEKAQVHNRKQFFSVEKKSSQSQPPFNYSIYHRLDHLDDDEQLKVKTQVFKQKDKILRQRQVIIQSGIKQEEEQMVEQMRIKRMDNPKQIEEEIQVLKQQKKSLISQLRDQEEVNKPIIDNTQKLIQKEENAIDKINKRIDELRKVKKTMKDQNYEQVEIQQVVQEMKKEMEKRNQAQMRIAQFKESLKQDLKKAQKYSRLIKTSIQEIVQKLTICYDQLRNLRKRGKGRGKGKGQQ